MHPVFNHSIYFCLGYFITYVEVVNTSLHLTNYKKLFFSPLILCHFIKYQLIKPN